MQKGGEGVQIACKIAYVLNGRPHGVGKVSGHHVRGWELTCSRGVQVGFFQNVKIK